MITALDYFLGDPDPRTINHYYFNSSIPLLLILTLYLYFSMRWGVNYMEFRRPLKLRKIFIVFDILQILGCSVITILTLLAILKMDWSCGEINHCVHFVAEPQIFMFYHVLKVMDLVETVFHVLNKRDDHNTLPLLYHHTMMVVLTWLLVRYAPGGHSMFLPFINSSVNIVKYSSYLTTACNKSLRLCIYWRENNGKIQLVQLGVAFIIYLQPFLKSECSFPKGILLLGFSQLVLLTICSIYYCIDEKYDY